MFMTKKCFVKILAVSMFLNIIAGLFVGNAQAQLKKPDVLCGRDALCKSLEGREFNIIRYYSMGSALVILYDSAKITDLSLFVPKFDYSSGRGTISDAADFLTSLPKVNGFAVLKAGRSVGWFKTEVIEGVYVIKPQYEAFSEYHAPDYRFSDKGGKLIMYIQPIFIEKDDLERVRVRP